MSAGTDLPDRIWRRVITGLPLLTACWHAGAQPAGAYCPAVFEAPPAPVVATDLEPDTTHISAGYIDFVEDGVSRLQGNVALSRPGWQAQADEVFYDTPNERAELRGAVRLWRPDVFMRGANADIDFGKDTSRIEDAVYYLPEYQGRGTAARLFTTHGSETIAEHVDYTTCAPKGAPAGLEGEFWKLSASSMRIDHTTERASGRNVTLRIKGMPVFYSPWLTFPLNRKRKSGLLAPSVGMSGHGGMEGRVPYYWNIAPNMDATITARALADSGVMGMFEYRYLFSGGSGTLNLDYLPDDANFAGRDRSMISLTHTQRILERGSLSMVYNRVSDPEYLEDFGAQIRTYSASYLPRSAVFNYQGDNWQLAARALGYQVTNRNVKPASRPYKNLPRVWFSYHPWTGNKRLNFRLTSELTHFSRAKSAAIDADVTGLRADLYPFVSYPVRNQAGFLIPKVGLRHTHYRLSRRGPFMQTPSRTLPIASLDGGLFLERSVRLRDQDYLQTLEPRLFYLYVPDTDQSDLPMFDSAVLNLDYNALFRENRFSGGDRVGDANQLTWALGSRLSTRADGKQIARLQLAQTLFLKDRNVIRHSLTADGTILAYGEPDRSLLSPLVAELEARLNHDWTVTGELQWDPDDGATHKLALKAQYNPAGARVVNFAYRVRRAPDTRLRQLPTDIEQWDVSFSWPVNDRLNAVGRWNYALAEQRSLDLFAGLEYAGCCFALKAVGRRYLATLNGDFDTGFFLQFELKGLGGLGASTADFLYQTISGYRPWPDGGLEL